MMHEARATAPNAMRLYNTESQRLEPFAPDGPVRLYVCGITPYDTTHLGHAFTYTNADLLVRYLERQGWPVRYVQNVTDIDDDILRKAAEVGEDWRRLGNRWTAHFIRDMLALNVRPPDEMPRATSAIPAILEMVNALMAQGRAYAAGGSVYYQVAAWPEFGRLSHLPREAMLPVANERGNRPDDPHKRHPLDFVLWQAQAPGEPAWPSPWGAGRPGWHIECSALSTQHLGPRLDLHGGGADLIFPHHEAEIAQSEAVTGQRPFVRVWLHTAMVEHAGAKMSKSLGNLVLVHDLLKDWPPDALRLYLGRHHYRQVWAHDPAELAASARLAEAVLAATTVVGGDGAPLDHAEVDLAFSAAMDDDLNTPVALHLLESLAASIRAAAGARRDVVGAQAVLRDLGRVFGLRFDANAAEPSVTAGWSRHLLEYSDNAEV
jgi:L-cysteine:1D-myo-inositol 2-amino-2-deoxy-alpha-D-glucopyranoside ligase